MSRPAKNRLAKLLGRFLKDARGGLAIWTAVLVPPIAILTVGGVELGSIAADRGRLQDAADMAALTAARELGFSGPGGVVERAQANALGELRDVAQHADLTARAELVGEREVRVRIDGHRMSFFGNLLPPGGFNFSAVSNASALGSTPLCVVGMQSTGNDVIHLTGSSRIQSPGCLVQSNRGLKVDPQAALNAGEVQVAGTAEGSITPTALVGSPILPDPFALRLITFPSICNVGDVLLATGGSSTLQPGLHCSDIRVRDGGVLTLAPGQHYFQNSKLRVENTGSVSGNGVTLFFDNRSQIEVSGSGGLSLWGARSGAWAGFIIVGSRTAGGDFRFDSDNVNRLEGVIYLPNNKLKVSGAAQAAEGSNWTVTLAREIEVGGSTSLVINANYAGSDVPVPAGVGPTPGTRLRR